MTEAVKPVEHKPVDTKQANKKAQEEKEKEIKELEEMVKDPTKGFDSDMDTYPDAVKEREERERKAAIVRNATARLEQIRISGLSGAVPVVEEKEKVLEGRK